MKKHLTLTMAAMLAVLSARADDPTKTFRTVAAGTGVYQSQNGAGKPVYGLQPIAGHDLVDAALGQPLGTLNTNQVLAMQIDCDSSSATLVVWDKGSSNSVATIATSTSFTVVQQQDVDTTAAPNRERFVAQFVINPNNNLLGGNLTLAGRLHLDPATGCPRAIRVENDRLDHIFGDGDIRNPDDPDDKDPLRAGIGHAVGVINLIFNDGSTNTVLLPLLHTGIRGQLN